MNCFNNYFAFKLTIPSKKITIKSNPEVKLIRPKPIPYRSANQPRKKAIVAAARLVLKSRC